jgi:alpha-beta hydrolase superfamily lysophospholipase
MSQSLDLTIDVTDAAALGEPATIAVTVQLPDADRLGSEPVVCIGKPGGGYAKEYFTLDLPGPARGAQSDWHTERGWVFVAVDHLGVGASSTHHDGARLDYTTLAAASQAAEQEVLRRLAEGALVDDFPAVRDPLVLGIGQSMGGCMTVVQQGRYHCYDGIGVLGYSAVHTHPPVTPGDTPITAAWIPRDTLQSKTMMIVNGPQLAAAALTTATEGSWERMTWGFHYADVDADTLAADMQRDDRFPEWASATMPTAVAASCLTPGAIAPEAAAVLAPVLVAMGERDVIADPKGEPRAYLSATSVDLFICPRMGHMHNFAGTRELMWQRIETWADWVRVVKRSAAA